MLRQLTLAAACTAALAAGTAHAQALAENLIGITDTIPARLVSFDSTAPGVLTGSVTITGIPLSAAGASYSPIALDFRPATNQAFMVLRGPDSTQCQLYSLAASGVATAVGSSTYLCGNPGEIDFNPSVDRVRVMRNGSGSASADNYRLNPANSTRLGAVVGSSPARDTLAAYVSGDTGFGTPPAISGTAYDQNVSSTGGPTTLFAIDIGRTPQRLVQVGGVNGTPSPNDGGVTTINSTSGDPGTGLGITIFGDPSFDISGATGAAYLAAFINTAPAGSPMVFEFNLYDINLITGAAARLGTTTIGAGNINGLVGMTVAPASFDVPASFLDDGGGAMPAGLLLALAALGLLRRARMRRSAT